MSATARLGIEKTHIFLGFLKKVFFSVEGYLEDIYYSGRPDFRETYYERSDILF